MDRFGRLIREKREARRETVPQLARRLKISPVFVKHIEGSPLVPVSDRLLGELAKHYAVSKVSLVRLITPRNKKARLYYKNYRRKNAA